jgi:hypothetical protein
MKTDAIIRRLVDDLRPVHPVPPVGRRLAHWSVAAVAVLALEIGVALARGIDLTSAIRPPSLAHAILPVALALVAAAAALRLSIPGVTHRSAVIAWVVLTLWAGSLAAAVATGPPLALAAWTAAPAARCAAHIAAAAVPGCVALLWLMRAGATLNGRHAGLLIALAAGALGAVATQLTCPNQSGAHLLLWHTGSVLAIAISGIGMRRLLTSWNQPSHSSLARAD